MSNWFMSKGRGVGWERMDEDYVGKGMVAVESCYCGG